MPLLIAKGGRVIPPSDIQIEGSTTLDATAGNGSSSTVTIPAAATSALIMCTWWDNVANSVASVTVDGQAATNILTVTNGVSTNGRDSFYVTGFSTGSNKTISWTWDSNQAISEGGHLIVIWVSNADWTTVSYDSYGFATNGSGTNDLTGLIPGETVVFTLVERYSAAETESVEMITDSSVTTINSLYDDIACKTNMIDIDWFVATETSHTIYQDVWDYSAGIAIAVDRV